MPKVNEQSSPHRVTELSVLHLRSVSRNEEAITRGIAAVLNEHNVENDCNVPDFVLAEYLVDCLASFIVASNHARRWSSGEIAITSDHPGIWKNRSIMDELNDPLKPVGAEGGTVAPTADASTEPLMHISV